MERESIRSARRICACRPQAHCARRIGHIRLIDPGDGHIYAELRDGKLHWWDAAYVSALPRQSDTRVALDALGLDAEAMPDTARVPVPLDIERERHYTFGRWG